MLRNLRYASTFSPWRIQVGHQYAVGAVSCSSSSAQAIWSRLQSTYEVPEGHHGSDLSDNACNISLMRLRDVTLRQDISLETGSGYISLAGLMKGQRVVLIGVPDGGKVCSETHVPQYVRKYDDFKKFGASKLICLYVGSFEKGKKWADEIGMPQDKVELVADPKAKLTRALGMEQNPVDSPGPKSHRYAAIIDDGILMRIRVEHSPALVSHSGAEEMLKLMKEV